MKYLLISIVFFLSGVSTTLLVSRRYRFFLNSESRNPVSNSGSAPAAPASKTSPTLDYLKIKKRVLPDEGFRLKAAFEDLGPKLIAVGAIDPDKFAENFKNEGGLTQTQREILTQKTNIPIFINEKNAIFMVDFFWALGLANKNRILDEGPMTRDRTQLGNFASTGGWTIGRRKAVDLFSRFELIKLSGDQQKIVEEVAAGVYRPCCGNPTNFPDCNHGMAALGLAEYLASKNFTRDDIFQALLYFNSFWFPQNYLDLAAYFESVKGVPWTQVNPQLVLGSNYSSGQGFSRTKQEMEAKLSGGSPPSYPNSGRGCGA